MGNLKLYYLRYLSIYDGGGRVVQVVTHFGLQVGNRGSIPLGLTPGRVSLVIARRDKPRALALGAGINISPQARGRTLEKTPF